MQLLIYIIVFPFLWLLSILPTRILYVISSFLYFLVYYIFGYRKKVVNGNLKLCFPDKSKKEIKSIEKKFYLHLCDMLVESIRSISISEAEIRERYKFTNIEEVNKIEEANKSIMLMCAHYASWEWIFIIQKYVTTDGYAIYKKIENKYFDQLIRKIRAKYNTNLITNKETFTSMRAHKRLGKKGIYGFLSDQSPKLKSAYYWKEFMNIKVPVHTGAEKLAKELDLAIVFFKTKKIKRGYYETTFKTVTLNPNEIEDYQITDLFINYLEDMIHEEPAYYLWTHKRWKHRNNVPKEFQ
ncbi:MAG: lipid A biosynthesis acyltransferase [Flavobacteriales bacterium]|nr:MAG: lipid A biosynthesis acyltransferase [Flavobacteriales bacterium]